MVFFRVEMLWLMWWSGGPGLEPGHPRDIEHRQPSRPHRVRCRGWDGGPPRLPEARPGQPRALPESLSRVWSRWWRKNLNPGLTQILVLLICDRCFYHRSSITPSEECKRILFVAIKFLKTNTMNILEVWILQRTRFRILSITTIWMAMEM